MKRYWFLQILVSILIIITGIAGVYNVVTHNMLSGLLYGLVFLSLVILYLINLLVDSVIVYHQETRILRADLSKLNQILTEAFGKVDNNFEALVTAMDDFMMELNEEEE